MAAQSLASGQITLGASAVQLSTSLDGTLGLIVKAKSTNTGNVFIGPSSVTTANGLIVEPGEALPVDLIIPSALWVVGTSGDVVSYLALRNT